MKKFLYCLLLISGSAVAQRDSTINMDVKLNFFSPIDVFNFPTIDLSLEHRITNNFSVSVEGGYEFYHFNKPDTSFINPSGYKLASELRLYHPFKSAAVKRSMHTSLTGFYLGVDFFYRQEQYNSAVEFTKSGGDSTVFIDNYWTRKKATGTNLTVGYQWSPYRRIVADAFLGVGMLRRTIERHELSYSEKEGDEISTSSRTDSFFSAKDLRETNGPGLSLAFGVKIGFVIY
ncbi:MAG: DUF3575 domain-containing protein [Bacteroidota bacterium]|nr:DUF3575 domain-containing protein [Bacteroidota bacterium]